MSVSSPDFPKNIPDGEINKLLLSIRLPRATKIVAPEVNASFHDIYMITLPPGKKVTSRGISCDDDELVLRVAANYWPRVKTLNEHGVMSYIAKHTNIPIPKLIAWDASVNNVLGYEWTLLSRVSGETLSDIWRDLDANQMGGILDQLADILVELHSRKFNRIGGIPLHSDTDKDNDWVAGWVIDETFWAIHEFPLWPAGSSDEDLNIHGPFENYVDYIASQIELYTRQIQAHDKLKSYRHLVRPLQALLAALKEHAEELNKTRLVLAHKDLHFGNIMYDRKSSKITGILDWEFSGVVPAPKWNPRKAFLWNCDNSDNNKAKKERLLGEFMRRCKDRGVKPLPDEVEYTSPRQKAMQEIADHVRAIIEVEVKNQYLEDVKLRADLDERVRGWEETVIKALTTFGINVP
ncbi:kinase-like domain-containing protein [Rostrohypoxylon terebratum]|nr:kinase-like domain-containing protein [Rostrohypoxylon terebratum]